MIESKKEFRAEIERRFSPEEAERIWKRSLARLAKIYQRYPDLPKAVSLHTDAFIFPAAAIYLSIKELSSEEAYDIVK